MTRPQLLVNYTLAHSSPRGGWGARTPGGLYERQVCERALPAFRARCEADGHEVLQHAGALGFKIRMIEKAIRAAQRDGRPWVSVSLHFNSTPRVPCPNPGCVKPEMEEDDDGTLRPVRNVVQAGLSCPHCGRAVPWRLGHTLFAWHRSQASQQLADRVMGELDEAMPWSPRKRVIQFPDPTRGRREWPNDKAWPRGVYRPAVLVEAGFAQDPRFCSWIEAQDGPAKYGLAVADGVCAFYDNWLTTPLTEWHL